jgi:hypothetical protein
MASVILTHLGGSIPLYIKDCVHQLRLWNPNTPIYIILEPMHKENVMWAIIESFYAVNLVYTDTLFPTAHHTEFRVNFKGDLAFRTGYWKLVKERFFYIEELIAREHLKDTISMEYDVLVYYSLETLKHKLRSSHRTLRMVMDNDTRGHPGFMYIPTIEALNTFNTFLSSIAGLPYSDMDALSLYVKLFDIHFLPVITESRNRSIAHRCAKNGYSCPDTSFLSEDSEHLGVLFDSAVAGQWLGGVDSRNTGGHKALNYENEGALYSIREMPFEWRKHGELWQPILDNRVLATIHVHSKALSCFVSDRVDRPTPDYDVNQVYASLVPN